MGRLLGPADYGILGALFSILYLVTFSFGIIRTIIVRFTSDFKSQEKLGKVKSLMIQSLKKLIMVGLVFLIGFSLVSFFIADFLKIDTSLVVIIGFYLFFILLSVVPTGILNGMQRFMSINMVNFLSTFIKLVLGVAAIWLGTGLFGVLVALSVSQLLAFLIPFLFLIPILKSAQENLKSSQIIGYR